jgi:hypothetical protein
VALVVSVERDHAKAAGQLGDLMSTVVMHNVVSVDGFISDADDQGGPLVDWYNNGDVPLDETA